MLQVEAAQAEVERRREEAERRGEEVAARERALKRQEEGLEGVKVGATQLPSCQCTERKPLPPPCFCHIGL